MFAYEEFKEKFDKPCQRKKFNEAVWQIENDPDLSVRISAEVAKGKPVNVKSEPRSEDVASLSKASTPGGRRKRKLLEPSGESPLSKRSATSSLEGGCSDGGENPLPARGRSQPRRRTKEDKDVLSSSPNKSSPSVTLPPEATPTKGANEGGGTPATRYRTRQAGGNTEEGEAGSYIKQLSMKYAERKEGRSIFSPQRTEGKSPATPLRKIKGREGAKTKTPQGQSSSRRSAMSTSKKKSKRIAEGQTHITAYISSRTRSSTRQRTGSAESASCASPDPVAVKIEFEETEGGGVGEVKGHLDVKGSPDPPLLVARSPSEVQQVASGGVEGACPKGEELQTDNDDDGGTIPPAKPIEGSSRSPEAKGGVSQVDPHPEAWLDMEAEKTTPRGDNEEGVPPGPPADATIVDLLAIAAESTVTPPGLSQPEESAEPGEDLCQAHALPACVDHVTKDQDHVTKDQDHVTADQDRATEDQDHVTEGQDYVTEDQDHVTEGQDHVTEDQDHVTEDQDHVTEDQDRVTEGQDHVIEDQDHVTEQPADETEHHVTKPGVDCLSTSMDHVTDPGDHVTDPGDHVTGPEGHANPPTGHVTESVGVAGHTPAATKPETEKLHLVDPPHVQQQQQQPLPPPLPLPHPPLGSAFPMLTTPSSLLPLDLSGSDAVEAALSATDHAMFELDSDIISLLSEVPDTMMWESPVGGGGAPPSSSSGGRAPSTGGVAAVEGVEGDVGGAFSFPGDVFDVGVKVQQVCVQSVDNTEMEVAQEDEVKGQVEETQTGGIQEEVPHTEAKGEIEGSKVDVVPPVEMTVAQPDDFRQNDSSAEIQAHSIPAAPAETEMGVASGCGLASPATKFDVAASQEREEREKDEDQEGGVADASRDQEKGVADASRDQEGGMEDTSRGGVADSSRDQEGDSSREKLTEVDSVAERTDDISEEMELEDKATPTKAGLEEDQVTPSGPDQDTLAPAEMVSASQPTDTSKESPSLEAASRDEEVEGEGVHQQGGIEEEGPSKITSEQTGINEEDLSSKRR